MILPKGFDFTQSKLQDYMDCPYRFYMRYILQTKWPALVVDDALEFEQRGQAGARFHRLVQQYLMGVSESRLSEIAAADVNPEMIRWWEDFLTYVPPLLEGDRYVEAILSTNLLEQRLLAKYDLILVKDNNTLTIFDWKTSQKQARKEWLLERIQTRLYQFILAKAGSALTNNQPIEPDQISMMYWFTASPQTPVVLPYSQSMYAADEKDLTRLISEILEKGEKDYTRTNNLKACRYCVYRSHCDRGIEAGDLSSFEDFEIESENFGLDFDFENITEIKF